MSPSGVPVVKSVRDWREEGKGGQSRRASELRTRREGTRAQRLNERFRGRLGRARSRSARACKHANVSALGQRMQVYRHARVRCHARRRPAVSAARVDLSWSRNTVPGELYCKFLHLRLITYPFTARSGIQLVRAFSGRGRPIGGGRGWLGCQNGDAAGKFIVISQDLR